MRRIADEFGTRQRVQAPSNAARRMETVERVLQANSPFEVFDIPLTPVDPVVLKKLSGSWHSGVIQTGGQVDTPGSRSCLQEAGGMLLTRSWLTCGSSRGCLSKRWSRLPRRRQSGRWKSVQPRQRPISSTEKQKWHRRQPSERSNLPGTKQRRRTRPGLVNKRLTKGKQEARGDETESRK